PDTPGSHHPQAERRQTLAVAGDSVVGAVPAYLSTQCLLLLDQRIVPMLATPLIDGTQPSAQPARRCFALHRPGSTAGAGPVMGEPQQVKALRFAVAGWAGGAVPVVGFVEPRQPGFLRVDLQSESAESLRQNVLHAL